MAEKGGLWEVIPFTLPIQGNYCTTQKRLMFLSRLFRTDLIHSLQSQLFQLWQDFKWQDHAPAEVDLGGWGPNATLYEQLVSLVQPTLVIEVVHTVGTPQMTMFMWNPDNHGQYWASHEAVVLTNGTNELTWGPMTADVWITGAVLIHSDDAVEISAITFNGDSICSSPCYWGGGNAGAGDTGGVGVGGVRIGAGAGTGRFGPRLRRGQPPPESACCATARPAG